MCLKFWNAWIFFEFFNLNSFNSQKIQISGFFVEELCKPFLDGRLNEQATVLHTSSGAVCFRFVTFLRLQEGLTTWKVPEDNFEERHGFGKTWQAEKLLRSLTGDWEQNRFDANTYCRQCFR